MLQSEILDDNIFSINTLLLTGENMRLIILASVLFWVVVISGISLYNHWPNAVSYGLIGFAIVLGVMTTISYKKTMKWVYGTKIPE